MSDAEIRKAAREIAENWFAHAHEDNDDDCEQSDVACLADYIASGIKAMLEKVKP